MSGQNNNVPHSGLWWCSLQILLFTNLMSFTVLLSTLWLEPPSTLTTTSCILCSTDLHSTDKLTGYCSSTTLNEKTPSYPQSLLKIHNDNPSLRSSSYISLLGPKACTSFSHFSFKFSAADDWNPVELLWAHLLHSLLLEIQYYKTTALVFSHSFVTVYIVPFFLNGL